MYIFNIVINTILERVHDEYDSVRGGGLWSNYFKITVMYECMYMYIGVCSGQARVQGEARGVRTTSEIC